MTLDLKIKQSQAHKMRIGLLYGALAGLAFSLVAWGYDGYLLARAHATLPWLQFTLGAVPTMLVGMIAAWITVRFDHLLINFIIWLAAGLLFAWVGSHVSFDLQTAALSFLAPDLADRVSYPFNNAARGLSVLIFMMIGILSIISSLLSANLIESSAEAGSIFGVIFPMLLWLAVFGFAGYAIENNYTERFRAAVVGANDLIQFAIDHEGQQVDKKLANQVHLRSAEPITDLLHRPRKLILSGYDEYLSAMEVWVDFNGVWVNCFVIDGLVNFCKKE